MFCTFCDLGVGKTACVRSAIAQLRQEQARGDLPNFQFFSLNGMEMRHPVEAYIRLWEGVSGGKEIRSAERACANLEDFFTSEDHDGTESISVVLLDEIDYLVTEKQTVLYNFFDWPKRAAEMGNGKRLIVIGISNTLNLAEQFLPSIQSRIGSERCCFKAYNLEDIISILKAKISEASPVSCPLPWYTYAYLSFCKDLAISRRLMYHLRITPFLRKTRYSSLRRRQQLFAVIFEKHFKYVGPLRSL